MGNFASNFDISKVSFLFPGFFWMICWCEVGKWFLRLVLFLQLANLGSSSIAIIYNSTDYLFLDFPNASFPPWFFSNAFVPFVSTSVWLAHSRKISLNTVLDFFGQSLSGSFCHIDGEDCHFVESIFPKVTLALMTLSDMHDMTWFACCRGSGSFFRDILGPQFHHFVVSHHFIL